MENGLEAIEKIKAEGLTTVEAIEIDVTNQQSVKAAREAIGIKTDVLDVLINNAGISGVLPQTTLDAGIDNFKNVNETNLYGVVSVTQTFIHLLQKSPEPRILNLSSSVGSLSLQSDLNWPFYHHAKYAVYSSSKSALNI